MNKLAISVSLEPGNLLWLQAMKAHGRHRSMSEVLDSVIGAARGANGRRREGVRSVRGTIAIPESDPTLKRADAVLRGRFEAALWHSRRRGPAAKRTARKS